jgi:hypothetical protein
MGGPGASVGTSYLSYEWPLNLVVEGLQLIRPTTPNPQRPVVVGVCEGRRGDAIGPGRRIAAQGEREIVKSGPIRTAGIDMNGRHVGGQLRLGAVSNATFRLILYRQKGPDLCRPLQTERRLPAQPQRPDSKG